MEREEAQAYWDKGISLEQALMRFAPPKLLRKYQDACQAKEHSCTCHNTLIYPDPPEYADVKHTWFSPDDSLISSVEDEIRNWICQGIRRGKFVAVGQNPHDMEGPIEEIPADAFDYGSPAIDLPTNSNYVQWDGSRIAWLDKRYINVRIARRNVHSKRRNGRIVSGNQTVSTRKKGRRSYRETIVGVYETRKSEGQVDFSAPLRVEIDKIRDSIEQQKLLTPTPSPETIRKYISSDFNAIKRSLQS